MTITREFVQSVRNVIAENPAIPLEQLARTLDAPAAYVIMALPISMRTRARPSDLAALWESLSTWENVSLRCVSPATFSATSSGGKEAGNSLSVLDGMPVPPLGQEEVGFIWLVSLPTTAGESYSVRLFNKDGHPILSVHLEGKASVGLNVQDRNSFDAIRNRFGVIPKPKKHCKGCGKCSCRKNKRIHPVEQAESGEAVISIH